MQQFILRLAENESSRSNEAQLDQRCGLAALAAHCMRRCLEFFNGRAGLVLRLKASGHEPTTASNHYCALCRQHNERKRPKEKKWREHRFSVACNLCNVTLHLRVYQGPRKSCWALWSSTKILSLRNALVPQSEAGGSNTDFDCNESEYGRWSA